MTGLWCREPGDFSKRRGDNDFDLFLFDFNGIYLHIWRHGSGNRPGGRERHPLP